jgi:hypothetical protein
MRVDDVKGNVWRALDAGSTGCRAHTFRVVPGPELPAFALRTLVG